jgi:biopolymer transport protein ExbD
MKIRGSGGKANKIELQMAPMIDIVFQLLIFFLLTLRISEPEGDFSVNMPIAAPAQAPQDVLVTPLKVRLTADPETGELAQLFLNGRALGNGPEAFARLNSEMLNQTWGPNSRNPLADDLEVEIDVDYELNYEYFIKAVSNVTGKIVNGQLQRYVEKIKFAPPREPRARQTG